MAVCSIGLLTKRFTEALDALDPRPYHALLAMGVRPLPAICHSVLPQLREIIVHAVNPCKGLPQEISDDGDGQPRHDW